MRALTWHGKRDVRVDTVPDPTIQDPTDVIVRVTSTGICGSDLHLYEVLGPFIDEGDILGHEPMGVVEEVGAAVTNLSAGDRVVVPFQIACGSCWMCSRGLPTQCETTQVRDQGSGAPIFGYSKLYGSVPGGQAEYLRVPQAQFTSIKVPHGPADERYVYLSDVLPTAWQAVEYAGVPDGGALAALGLYDFPGNVRELENILERALALATGDDIAGEDLKLAQRPQQAHDDVDVAGLPLQERLDAIERKAILDALEQTHYNRTAAAKRLGVTFRALRYRMERLGIKDELDGKA